MERSTRYCLLAMVAVSLGSLCVQAENDERMIDAYNDGLFPGDFGDDEEGTEAIQNLIDQFIDDVDSKGGFRDAILVDNLDRVRFGDEVKRAGRCRGATKCIMRGPNPNTSSRVLPFGKRGSSPNTLARRGRGSPKNSRARGGRTILPFGKRR